MVTNLARRGAGIGFYGKVPSHGDFVARRLPPELIAAWDGCLQAGLQSPRDRLGSSWLAAYLHFPVWHFVLSRAVCGGKAWAGVLMPSVDKVGRYYPLLVAGELLGQFDSGFDQALAAAPVCDHAWFELVEGWALSALQHDFSLDDFDAALGAMQAPRQVADALLAPLDTTGSAHQLQAMACGLDGTSLFWHQPLAPAAGLVLVACAGLPDATLMASMLEGVAH